MFSPFYSPIGGSFNTAGPYFQPCGALLNPYLTYPKISMEIHLIKRKRHTRFNFFIVTQKKLIIPKPSAIKSIDFFLLITITAFWPKNLFIIDNYINTKSSWSFFLYWTLIKKLRALILLPRKGKLHNLNIKKYLSYEVLELLYKRIKNILLKKIQNVTISYDKITIIFPEMLAILERLFPNVVKRND